MARTDRKTLIQEIEQKRGSKVFCYLTSDRQNLNVQVQKDVLPIFVNQLGVNKNYDKVDLFIFTQGGDTMAAFGLSRLLREHTKHVGALVADKCHSAGTLFSLGANDIVMTSGATLSPIDPSLVTPLNPAVQTHPNQPAKLIPLSVESVAGFKSLVENEWKLSNTQAKAEAFKVLTGKVHPLALGDVFRARQQIELLATSLLKQHRSDNSKIKKIVDVLSKQLGSHDYLIYRNEAISILGSQVKRDSSVEELIWKLYLDFRKEMELGLPFDVEAILRGATTLPAPGAAPTTGRSASVEFKLVLIEHAEGGSKAIKKADYKESIQTLPNGQQIRNISEEIKFVGWEEYQ